MFYSILCLLVSFSVIFCGIIDNKITNNCDDLLPEGLKDEIDSYRPTVGKIINAVVKGEFTGSTYNELAKFVDKFGNRYSGTENLERAIDYMLNISKVNKLDNVHGEEAWVPNWIRGNESATLLEPRRQNLPLLGLGSSIGTPPEGITAEVFVVQSFDELEQNSTKANGKIVVFIPEWVSYGVTVQYRQYSATKAATHGAVASLVRSITPFSLDIPHAGWQDYDANVTKIPTAAITVEDAHMMKRMQDRGEKIVVNLKMEAKTLNDSLSRNTVAEIQGSSNPEKVVIVSGHLDSWDVGQGAMDDGGGAFISYNALVVLKALGLQAKRTLRSILWTGEEEGLIGAFAYKAAHANETENFIFIMESDEGTFAPYGLTYRSGDQGSCIVQEVIKLFDTIDATTAIRSDDVGSDIEIWLNDGIPGASLLNANENYFWFHHSNADTMDVENSTNLDRATAIWAASAYVLADLSIDFPRN